jgi:predicted permease
VCRSGSRTDTADMAVLMLKIFATALLAMVKVFVVIGVGVYIALHPKKNPYLPAGALKYVSRLSNGVFLPFLVVSSLGSTLTPDTMKIVCVLIPFALIVMSMSYILALSLGKYINNEPNNGVFESLAIAAASPNAISLPIMIMETLCEQPIINADFNGSPSTCAEKTTSMLFVYSVGW